MLLELSALSAFCWALGFGMGLALGIYYRRRRRRRMQHTLDLGVTLVPAHPTSQQAPSERFSEGRDVKARSVDRNPADQTLPRKNL